MSSEQVALKPQGLGELIDGVSVVDIPQFVDEEAVIPLSFSHKLP